MPETIISFAGHPGSGKSQLTKNLEKHQGIPAIRPSELIQRYAIEHYGIDLSGADRSQWADIRRRVGESSGQDWIAQHVLDSPHRIVSVDGLRTVIDYRKLKNAHDNGLVNVAFMGLFCPIEERFNHIDRGDTNKRRPQSVEELYLLESSEYFSNEGDAGIATQTVLDLTPPELRIEIGRESAETIYNIAVGRLIRFGFIK